MSKRPTPRDEEAYSSPSKRPAPRRPPPWAEPGGDADPRNPRLRIPSSVRRISLRPSDEAVGDEDDGPGSGSEAAGGKRGDVTDAEIAWMASRRPLTYDPRRLALAYGPQEASLMGAAVRAIGMPKETAGALAYPGVGTRWSRFVAWWQEQTRRQDQPQPRREMRPMTSEEALAGFAKAAGRVRTYRALALDENAFQTILDRDEIFPTGLLRPGVTRSNLAEIIEEHGARKVAVCRLYISQMHRIGGADPSYSLHDDWQTTCVIASEYATKKKKVHLFEVDVPAVESLGWTLQDVSDSAGEVLPELASDREEWFRFVAPGAPGGVWLDARLQRTERFGLHGVHSLRERLRSVRVFDSVAELREAVRPFVKGMEREHRSGGLVST